MLLRRVARLRHQWFARQHRAQSDAAPPAPLTSLDRLLRFKPAISAQDDANDGVGDEGDGMNTESSDLAELGDDPLNPLFKLGKSLLKLGKVHYRHIDGLPPWMEERQQQVSSHRTPAQIRRCLQNWMVQPDREMQQRYRLRKLTWRNSLKDTGPQQTGSSSSTNNTASAGGSKMYAYGPEETVAYSAYFMPSRFQITRRVLREVQQLMPAFRPTSMLDFGCGPGTAGCAALDVWGSGEDGVVKYAGIDASRAMLDAAKIMLGAVGGGPAGGVGGSGSGTRAPAVSASAAAHSSSSSGSGGRAISDAVFHTKTSDVLARAVRGGARFDLAVSTFTLSELANDPTRRAATQVCVCGGGGFGCLFVCSSCVGVRV